MADASAITQDWEQREFVDSIKLSVLKMAQFLNGFGKRFPHIIVYLHIDLSIRDRLAKLNSRLATLERHVEFLEQAVTATDADAA